MMKKAVGVAVIALSLITAGAGAAGAATNGTDSVCSGDTYVTKASNSSIVFTQASQSTSSVTGVAE